MKKFYAILSFFLLFFVLTGSIGVNFYKSYCNMRGESMTFLTSGNDLCDLLPESNEKSCCAKTAVKHCGENGSENKSGCCDEEEYTLLIELPFSENIEQLNISSFALIVFVQSFFAVEFSQVDECLFAVNRFRPPPSRWGRELLTFVSVFRI